MTPEELKKMNEIVSAYTEGKTTEFRKRTDSFVKSYIWKN